MEAFVMSMVTAYFWLFAPVIGPYIREELFIKIKM
jgi:hypothetical protein